MPLDELDETEDPFRAAWGDGRASWKRPAALTLSLKTVTMADLSKAFHDRKHYPSEEHWGALEDVAETLEAMANGTAAHKVYLSAIDCGVGKSSAAHAFAAALVNSPDHRRAGMLICVARNREAVAAARELKALGASVAIWTADDAVAAQLRSIGTAQIITWDRNTGVDGVRIAKAQIERAQVLICTQQRVEQALEKVTSFASLKQFHYQGRPRQIRVWDEAFLPGTGIVLNRNMLGGLLSVASKLNTPFHKAIDAFMDVLKRADDGEWVAVPDWTGVGGDAVNVYSVLQMLTENGTTSAELRATVKGMFRLGGRSARVRFDNKNGPAALEYHLTIPDDMAPLLVLDASGRVRQTYRDMESRGLVLPLRSAIKDYSPLTVHWWPRGGGKASFQRGGVELAEGTAKTIASKPDEDWLVVTHKPSRWIRNVETLIKRKLDELTPMTGTVHFTTWGKHLGTNEWADVPNVVLCGTLFLTDANYVTLTHLCKDQPLAGGFVSDVDWRRTAKGETADGVLQAVLRGRVRKSKGSLCQPMDAYVIADPTSGMAEILPDAFRGATIVDWNPLAKHDTSKAKQALDHVTEQIKEGVTWVSFKSIKVACGVPAKADFWKLVLKAKVWINGLAAQDLEIMKRGREAGIGRSR